MKALFHIIYRKIGHKVSFSVLILAIIGLSNIFYYKTIDWSPGNRKYGSSTRSSDETEILLSKTVVSMSKANSTDSFHVCPGKSGRFGNAMFEYASSYGIAKSVNRTLVIPDDDELHALFDLSARVVSKRSISCKKYHFIPTKLCCSFDEGIYDRVSKFRGDVTLRGYFQSWRYFQAHRADILKEFTCKAYLVKLGDTILHIGANTFYPGRRDVIFVGVHIRREDMVLPMLRNTGYNVATGEYVRRGIEHFKSKLYKPIVFVVVTLDMSWAKQELQNLTDDKIYYVQNTKSEIDFSVLVKCNHTIMTVGTFGWWAGYLAGGDVIYYKYPVKENSKRRAGYNENFTDYFPGNWIGMD